MFSYTVVDAVCDFIGLASTVAVSFWLVSGLQPQVERLRDSCQAWQPPEGRALLLWSAFMVPVTWVAAAVLYFHNLFSLWHVMGNRLEKQPVNRPVYAFLHLYLFSLLLCGIYASAIMIFEIAQLRKDISDLWMILRFKKRKCQVIQDTEARYGFSDLDSTATETEVSAAVGSVRSTTLLPQDEGMRGNTHRSSGNFAPTEPYINEPEETTKEAAWPGLDTPVGEIISRTVDRPILDSSVECSIWPRVGACNNTQATGPSITHQPTLDSDGDAITMTLSSSSSSNASSGIDGLDYVDDDNEQYGLQGVRVRGLLDGRKRMNRSASSTMGQHDRDDGDNDDNLFDLYYTTPRLRPQDQNARTKGQPFDTGEPQSPCDSCSSARAGSIPTAKRFPARVPITPTTPIADAEDADTEKTDVEWKQRERKNRNSAKSAPQINHAQMLRMSPPSDTDTILFKTGPNLSVNKEETKALKSHLAAHASERRAYTTARTRTSGKSKRRSPPTPDPVLCTNEPSPPQNQREHEAGISRRSREADNMEGIASGNGKANMVSFDGSFMFDKQNGAWRRVGLTPTKRLSKKRPGSPYPFADGRPAEGNARAKNLRVLSLDIPSVET